MQSTIETTTPVQPAPRSSAVAFAFLGSFGIMVATAIVAVIVLFLLGKHQVQAVLHNPLPFAVTAQLLSYPFVTAWLLVFVRKSGGLRLFGFGLPHVKDLGIGIFAGIVLLVLVDTSAALMQYLGLGGTNAESMLHRGDPISYVAAFFLMAAILAPICEEIAFRALLFNALRSRLGLFWGATISGFAFALCHMSAYTLLPLTLGGILLAYVYHRTGNIWTSITAHALFNTLNIFMVIR